MAPLRGAPPPDLKDLVRAQDRISFIYVERCFVHRDSNAITARDQRGTVHIPAASLGALILGPGATVSHQAITLLAESGSTAVWVGERGVRYYAHGRSLSGSSRLLEAQARIVSNKNERMRVARAMYGMRFPDEDVSRLSMHQLRGREGARVRRAYRQASQDSGVAWDGRAYDPNDFDAGDTVNKALSAATACLYGVAHAVIVALGCAPGLGVVHTGHARSFVYDIADLYKAEIAVPVAFSVAAAGPEDVGGTTRRAVRDAIRDGLIMTRISRDIKLLLLGPSSDSDEDSPENYDVIELWDGRTGTVSGGISYGQEAVIV
ncbi:MAG: type I-E CRISPR-associated endonuclease Cas1e [Bifidobacteriaceae bacterium]|jgi:CRISPR-associated protein Cas1|nr:type I-E CRISPR-associated endonuclease Cas1e [Bifidobacteriaceae bacterium]